MQNYGMRVLLLVWMFAQIALLTCMNMLLSWYTILPSIIFFLLAMSICFVFISKKARRPQYLFLILSIWLVLISVIAAIIDIEFRASRGTTFEDWIYDEEHLWHLGYSLFMFCVSVFHVVYFAYRFSQLHKKGTSSQLSDADRADDRLFSKRHYMQIGFIIATMISGILSCIGVFGLIISPSGPGLEEPIYFYFILSSVGQLLAYLFAVILPMFALKAFHFQSPTASEPKAELK